MEKQTSLAELSKDISNKLLESHYLLEILQDESDIETKFQTILSILEKNISSAFREIEACRKMIYILE